MSEFRVTFPQRFRNEPHPTLPQAHPDGWLTIEAPSLGLARDIAFYRLGDEWAFIYPDDDMRDHLYPLGEIARFKENE